MTLEARQIGHGDEYLKLTNEAGRILLDGDEVAALIAYLDEDELYHQWIEDRR